MCVDYRGLNSVTVRNGYPLPRIQDCLDQIGEAKWFTKIDLLSGFWQVRIHEPDIPKTAFNTRKGKWEFCVMPFGLTNAPATFQSMMNDELRAYLDDFVQVFIDDILIYSKTKEEHMGHIRTVLQKLKDAGLKAKPAKCSWMKESVEFCGHIVGGGVVRMDPSKLDAIQTWPAPRTVHDVRSFMGLAGYYRRFVKGFGMISKPLYDLLKG